MFNSARPERELLGRPLREDQAWQKFLEAESNREREMYLGYQRSEERRDHRNGCYERDFVTRFRTLRLRIARTRGKSFLPVGLERLQRRAQEVALLIREAFLWGISTRQVGRVVALLTEDAVSGQTVSNLARSLDLVVQEFQRAGRWKRTGCTCFLNGVNLRVRRPSGQKRVQMLVAYGVRADGSRQLLVFLRSQGESQQAWEGLLEDLYRREPEGPEAGLDSHQRLSGFGGRDSDRLPAVEGTPPLPETW